MSLSQFFRRCAEGMFAAALLIAGIAFAPAAVEKPAPTRRDSRVAVVSAAYRAERQRNRLFVTAEIELQQRGGGRQRLHLPTGDCSVETALLDGEPAALVRPRKATDGVDLLLNRPGRSRLKLALSVPLQRGGDDWTAVVDLVPDAPAQFTVSVAAGESLLLDGAELKRPLPIAQPAVHVFPVGNRRRVALRFRTSRSPVLPADRGKGDRLLLATSRVRVQRSNDAGRFSAETRLRASGPPRKSVTFSVPGRVRIVKIEAVGLAGWTVNETDDVDSRNTVQVRFRRAFAGTKTVRLQGIVATTGGTAWNVPNLIVAGADSHVGHVTVEVLRGGPVWVQESAGVRQRAASHATDTVALAGATQQTPQRRLEFDFWQQEFELVLASPRPKQAGIAVATTVVEIDGESAALQFDARLEFGRLPPRLKLTLPAEWQIRQVRVGGDRARWWTLPLEAGRRHVTLDVPRPLLEGKSRGPIRLKLSAAHRLERHEADEAAELPLPVVRLPATRLLRGELFVRAAEGTEPSVADVNGLVPIAGKNRRDRLAYRYELGPTDETGFAGTLHVAQKRRWLAATSLTLAELRKQVAIVRHDLSLDAGSGELKKLQVELAGAPQEVRFSLKQTASRLTSWQAEPTGRGTNLWTLRLSPPVRERCALTIETLLPIPPDGKTTLKPVRVVDADMQPGFLIVVSPAIRLLQARGSQPVGFGQNGKPHAGQSLNEIALADMPVRFRRSLPHSGSSVRRVYRFASPESALALTVRPPAELIATLPVCERLALRSVLSEAGGIQNRAIYSLNGAAIREFRIRLPESGEPLAASINGAPLSIHRMEFRSNPDGSDDHSATDAAGMLVVRLPAGAATGRDRFELDYRTRFEKSGGTGELRQTPPEIEAVTLDGRAAPLTVLQHRWTLQPAAGIAVIASRGGFAPTEDLDASSWLHMLATKLAGRRPPESESPVKHFEYCGAPGNAPSLVIVWESRTVGGMWRLCVLAAVVFGCWMCRRRSVSFRARLAVTGLVLPAMLAVWSPAAWHVWLDGVILGTLAGCVLWSLQPAAAAVRTFVKQVRSLGAGSEASGTSARRSVHGTLPNGLPSFGLGKTATGMIAAVAVLTAAAASAADDEIREAISIEAAGDFPAHEIVLAGFDRPARPTGVSGTVSSANYSIHIQRRPGSAHRTASVAADFVLFSFRDAPTQLPLPLGPAAIRTAALDGRPATVSLLSDSAGDGGSLAVLVSSRGRHVLKIEFDLPLVPAASGGPRAVAFRLPLRPVASGRAVLSLPSPDVEAAFTGLKGAFHRAGQAVEFPIDRSRNVSVLLAAKRDSPQSPPSATVVAESTADIVDGGVFQTDEVTLSMVHGAAVEWTFALPNESKLINVAGPDVAGWEILPDKEPDGGRRSSGQRTMRIRFRRPVQGKTRISFHLFRAMQFSAEPAAVSIDPVRSLVPLRQEHTLSITADGGLQVREKVLKEARRIPVGAVRRIGTASHRPRFVYRLQEPSANVTLTVSRRTTHVAVTAAHTVTVGETAVRLSSRLVYRLRGAPQSNVMLFLPEGFTLHDLHGERDAEWSFGEESTLVYVTFPQPVAGELVIDLRGTFRRDAASPGAEITFPMPMGAQSLQNLVAVTAETGFTVRPAETQGWQRIEKGLPANSAAIIRTMQGKVRPVALHNTAAAPAVLGFRANQLEPNPLGIKLQRKRGAPQAEALTIVTATDAAVHYTVVLKWSGVPGNPQRVACSAPDWLGKQFRLRTSPRLRVQRVPQNRTPAGRTRWIVSNFDHSGEDVVLAGTATLPAATLRGNRIRGPAFSLESLTENAGSGDGSPAGYSPIRQSRQTVVLCNDTSSRIAPAPGSPNLSDRRSRPTAEEAAAWDLLPPDVQRRVESAVSRVDFNSSSRGPVWIVREADDGRSAAGTVSRAKLTTVLASDGTYRTTARYRVSGRHAGHLAIRMPRGSRLTTASVDGKKTNAVVVRRGEMQLHLVPLPATANDVAVQLLLSGSLKGDSELHRGRMTGGRVELPAPTVPSRRDDAELGMAVAGTEWTVYIPRDWRTIAAANPALSRVQSKERRDATGDAGRTRHRQSGAGKDRGASARELPSLDLLEQRRRVEREADRIAAQSADGKRDRPIAETKLPVLVAESPIASGDSEIGDLPGKSDQRLRPMSFQSAGNPPPLVLDVHTPEGERTGWNLVWTLFLGLGVVAFVAAFGCTKPA